MEQTIKVTDYGEVTFRFPQSLSEVLEDLQGIEKADDEYNNVLYSDELSDKEERKKELEKVRNIVTNLYSDCSELATETEISRYNKKKNGKFKKGTIGHFLQIENAARYDTEFTNSWQTFTIYGKAISENEIDVHMTLKWFTN